MHPAADVFAPTPRHWSRLALKVLWPLREQALTVKDQARFICAVAPYLDAGTVENVTLNVELRWLQLPRCTAIYILVNI